MKREDISKIIDGIDDELIEEVSAQREKEFFESRDKKRRAARIAVKIALPIASCIAVISAIPGITSSLGGIGSFSGISSTKSSVFDKVSAEYQSSYDSVVELKEVRAIAAAEYPVCAEYPDYSEEDKDHSLQESIYDKYNSNRRKSAYDIDKYSGFYSNLISSSLSECDDENRVISPVNLYIAASMLAEVSGGDTRKQILSALDVGSIEELRENAKTLWDTNYIYDRTKKQILSSSLWLNKDIKFKKPALKALAKYYYADSFSGDFGDPDTTRDMQSWLSKRTGGLLDEQISDIKLDESGIMDILTTVYFSAKWQGEFNQKFNECLIFHSPSGNVEAEFMCHFIDCQDYYRGENYGAAYKDFKGGGRMWLILPDEDSTVEEVISKGRLVDTLLTGKQDNVEQVMLNLKLPKFDVSSDIDLSNSFKAMGIENAFDINSADFSAITSQTHACVSKVNHAARVVIDEEGCKAAAFTEIPLVGAAAPVEKRQVDFILDRPFIFIIESDVGQPLFIGVVNNV